MTEMPHLIEEEVFAIRQSGEMPEVALHTALHYLQEDPEGPRVSVSPENLRQLKDAVENRYQRILMRDLNPRYRGRSIYRGLARAIANWQRLDRFCDREKRDITGHRQDGSVNLNWETLVQPAQTVVKALPDAKTIKAAATRKGMGTLRADGARKEGVP